MSSKNSTQRSQHYKQEPAYQPLPTSGVITTMDNPGLRPLNSFSGATLGEDVENTSAGGLPSTHSSQQLMPHSDNDAVDHLQSRRRGCLRRFTRSHWFTIAVLCFVNLINYMDRYTTAGVLSNIQDDFQIGDDSAGLLQTAFVLSYMVCAPVFGYLGDRYSRRWIMAIGVLLWSTTTLLGSFMTNFGWFITFRALVGIGEASYSTIAPTIISDLFVNDMRSKMLALFYFAIPVGSGFGYIVGSETARIAESWRWALRVTPILGIAAVILILLIQDPERGESEGSQHLEPTTYSEDIVDLVKNRSFMFSTAGFTCVAFVAGALSWWGPKFIFLGLRMQPGNETLTQNDVSYKFGIIAMIAGLIGVPLGSIMAQRLRPRLQKCDPYICAVGLLLSAPLVYLSLVTPQISGTLCFFLVFGAQVSLNLCWSIVADILLYVVIPTRRSTAEAFQILISHALGDAGSPYLVGVLSEVFKKAIRNSYAVIGNFASNSLQSYSLTLGAVAPKLNATELLIASPTESPIASAFHLDDVLNSDDTNLTKFEALQYALFSTCFVEVLGGIFFLITAAFILQDKNKATQAIHNVELKSVVIGKTRSSLNNNVSESSEDSECLVMHTDILLREPSTRPVDINEIS